MDFKSQRIARSASFEVNGTIETVFPLFGPILEKEWAEGWDPEIIYGSPDEISEQFVFRTNASTDEPYYTWVITQYRPADFLIEYLVHTSNRLWCIKVHCQPRALKTNTTVTYTYTGLNERGNELNREAMDYMFSNDLKDWQYAINHYLETGKTLTSK